MHAAIENRAKAAIIIDFFIVFYLMLEINFLDIKSVRKLIKHQISQDCFLYSMSLLDDEGAIELIILVVLTVKLVASI